MDKVQERERESDRVTEDRTKGGVCLPTASRHARSQRDFVVVYLGTNPFLQAAFKRQVTCWFLWLPAPTPDMKIALVSLNLRRIHPSIFPDSLVRLDRTLSTFHLSGLIAAMEWTVSGEVSHPRSLLLLFTKSKLWMQVDASIELAFEGHIILQPTMEDGCRDSRSRSKGETHAVIDTYRPVGERLSHLRKEYQ